MADAMCGPSNPLQQFKQQTQFDRTLQQDRLASRRAPTQGFRSANPEAGLLDPEFEAFQAGLPPSELPQFHPSQQRPPNFAGASQAPSWATDFQRMQISPPPTFQQQHVLQSTPANANWAQGFREQISQSGPSVRQSASSPQAFQYMARYGGMNGFQQNNFAQQNQAPLIQSKGKEAVTEQFDEAAFERAFNQASDALTAEAEAMETEAIPYERGASTGNYEEHTDQVGWEATDGGQVHADPANTQYMQQLSKDQDMLAQAQQEISNQQGQQSWPNLQRLESDPIAEEMLREDDSAMQIEEEQQDPEKQREDDDALALTAQELLEKVEHNKTDKFRNSQFLSLMRKLRDREVKVEGNDMVETSSADAVESVPTSTAPQLFDNTEQTPQALHSMMDAVTGVVYDGGKAASTNIPSHEQDHDAGPGRFDPRDGQAVVDLLNQPPGNANPNDIGTSDASTTSVSASTSTLPDGVFYGDLRQRQRETHQISEREVYDVPLDWKRSAMWSHRSAQEGSRRRAAKDGNALQPAQPEDLPEGFTLG